MNAAARPYPEPPWDTYGTAVFCPTLLRAEHLVLPAGVQPVLRWGWAVGMLAYVDYRAPSPLEYQELVWMPCLTQVTLRSGKRARGYHVAVMLVDSEASLAGGRELWKLPKTLASFRRTPSGVEVHAEDGTALSLNARAWGPSIRARSSLSTLQRDGEGYVRFRGRTEARLELARTSLSQYRPASPAWAGLAEARLLGVGATLTSFHATMLPPESLV